MILGGSAMLAGCATAPAAVEIPIVLAAATPPPPLPRLPQISPPPLDPGRLVRPELMSRAMAALDVHSHKITLRDRMYLVDFQKFSGDERLYEVDLHGGAVTLMRTSHGRGSDPAHTGFATAFGNTPDSHMSSVGAFATAGAGMGAQQGPNVLLDGLEYSNDRARERAIIIHGADYADPSFLAREGKLGRSYGCFSVAHADLPALRERMGEGRLLFAWA